MKSPVYPDDHPYKFFMIKKDTGSVFGVIYETEKIVCYHVLGTNRNGKFYIIHTHTESKLVLRNIEYICTLDYSEAYHFLINYNPRSLSLKS